MNIIYSTDEKYIKICATSLISLLKNNKSIEKIKIFILENNILSSSREKLENICKQFGRSIVFFPLINIVNTFEKNNNFPISAYARLFIQNINEDKIIYIDCDTVINGNLEKLWNVDITNYLVAGVQDPLPNYLKKVIGMNYNERYINSGVLIINLKKWREVNFALQVLNFIKEKDGNVVHHDQGIINGLCKGKILYLPPKYNLMGEILMMKRNELIKLYKLKEFYSEEEIDEAKENPIIIHYISKFYNRPWYNQCTHPYKNLFIKFLNLTNFSTELENKELSKRCAFRKNIYEKYPFFVYLCFERLFDIRRAVSIKCKRVKR